MNSNSNVIQVDESTLKLIIVDDEKESCDNLVHILTDFINDDIKILGVANDTREAELLINKLRPDFIVLDIEMPGENAFQFLKRIYPYLFEIIFVTAYDDFAIRAFKLNAVDYILKPINIDELASALVKMRERLKYKSFARQNDQLDLLRQITTKEQPNKIALRSLNHIEVVDFKDIYSIEGQGSYCKISYNKSGISKEIITSSILAYYEELLPQDLFYRIHKSYLINCLHIQDITIADNYSVILKTMEIIPVSRRRLAGFIQFLKENNFYSA